MSTRSFRILVLLALAAAGLPVAGQAQRGAGVIDEALTDVVPARAADDLRRDREMAAVAEQIASDSADQLRVEVSRARARIGIHKSELETIKKRLDLAKKEKRESDRLDLESARKAKEADLRLLERVRAMQEARHRLAEAQRDAARAWKRAVEAEQALDARRMDRPAAVEPGAVAARPEEDDEVRRTARRVIELRRDAATQRNESAARERDLTQRQLEVLDAQAAVLTANR